MWLRIEFLILINFSLNSTCSYCIGWWTQSIRINVAIRITVCQASVRKWLDKKLFLYLLSGMLKMAIYWFKMRSIEWLASITHISTVIPIIVSHVKLKPSLISLCLIIDSQTEKLLKLKETIILFIFAFYWPVYVLANTRFSVGVFELSWNSEFLKIYIYRQLLFIYLFL